MHPSPATHPVPVVEKKFGQNPHEIARSSSLLPLLSLHTTQAPNPPDNEVALQSEFQNQSVQNFVEHPILPRCRPSLSSKRPLRACASPSEGHVRSPAASARYSSSAYDHHFDKALFQTHTVSSPSLGPGTALNCICIVFFCIESASEINSFFIRPRGITLITIFFFFFLLSQTSPVVSRDPFLTHPSLPTAGHLYPLRLVLPCVFCHFFYRRARQLVAYGRLRLPWTPRHHFYRVHRRLSNPAGQEPHTTHIHPCISSTMSRNIRQNYTSSSGPRPRIKLTTKRRVSDTPSSSSLNLSGSEGLSDDEGYSGVDDVSESDDDDEEHVVAAEEEFLKKSARQPARPLIEDGNDADEEDDDDDDEPEEDDEVDGEDGSIEWPGLEEFHVYEPTGTYLASEELFTPVVERHVRFAGVPSSDSDSTDTDTDEEEEEEADQKFFPDIFIDQSVLDPGFRREIELEDCQSDSSGSFWDFHNASGDGAANDSGNELPSGNLDMTPMATPRGTPPPPNALKRLLEEEDEESEELDGYESKFVV